MLSHPEIQSEFRAALAGQDVPSGVTAVGDLARRFSVYRNTVIHSLIAALSQRFPVVRRIVGPDFFDAINFGGDDYRSSQRSGSHQNNAAAGTHGHVTHCACLLRLPALPSL